MNMRNGKATFSLETKFKERFAAARIELDKKLPDYMANQYSPLTVDGFKNDSNEGGISIKTYSGEVVYKSPKMTYGSALKLKKRIKEFLFAKGYRVEE